MGCITIYLENLKKKQSNEKENFKDIKEKLNDSLKNVSETLKDINDWDALFYPEEESGLKDEEFKLNKINKDDPKYNNISYFWLLTPSEKCIESKGCIIFFFICGILFCFCQLIGVQAGIVILNALFKEIIDEIKLGLKDIPRKYNFYENLEIASYKSVPEIDVGMTCCFLGTIFLKNYEYYMSNIFQLLALLCFILLFWLFDFHSGSELSYNYIQIEITVLIFSYLILNILVGASSIIGLKEFFNLYKNFYKKNCCNLNKYLCTQYLLSSLAIKCLKKKKKEKEKEKEKSNDGTIIDLNHMKEEDKKHENIENKEKSFEELLDDEYLKYIEEKCEKNKETDGNLEKFCFFFFSILSAFTIVGINKGIFTSFNNISTKNIFYPIIFVYAGSLVLSLLFYFFYSIPIINQKIKQNIKNIENNNIGNISGNQKEKEDEKNNNQESNKNLNVQINEKNDIKNEEIKLQKETIYKKLHADSDLETTNEKDGVIKNKIENNEEIIKKENNNIINININNYRIYNDNKDFRKACTCFGYIYFSKKVENKNICICYKYDSCCSWFCSKILKPEIFIPLLIEIYIQLSSVGYYSVISDKLLEEYSLSKIMKFLALLFIFILIHTLYVLMFHSCYSVKYLFAKKFHDNNININNFENNLYIKKCNIITFFMYNFLFLLLSMVIFIISIIYLCVDDHTGNKWDKQFQGGIIINKCLDLQMLSFFDFFDDEDCLNTSLFITVEKLTWMIIVVIFDISETKNKTLFIIQISASGLFFIISIFVLVCFFLDIKQSIKSKE